MACYTQHLGITTAGITNAIQFFSQATTSSCLSPKYFCWWLHLKTLGPNEQKVFSWMTPKTLHLARSWTQTDWENVIVLFSIISQWQTLLQCNFIHSLKFHLFHKGKDSYSATSSIALNFCHVLFLVMLLRDHTKKQKKTYLVKSDTGKL